MAVCIAAVARMAIVLELRSWLRDLYSCIYGCSARMAVVARISIMARMAVRLGLLQG